jgi:hypothetical protein
MDLGSTSSRPRAGAAGVVFSPTWGKAHENELSHPGGERGSDHVLCVDRIGAPKKRCRARTKQHAGDVDDAVDAVAAAAKRCWVVEIAVDDLAIGLGLEGHGAFVAQQAQIVRSGQQSAGEMRAQVSRRPDDEDLHRSLAIWFFRGMGTDR